MPQRKNDLSARALAGYETVEFVLRPVLLKERRRENHNAEAGRTKTAIDGSPQTIPHLQLELVIPNVETGGAQSLGQRPHEIFLILSGVRDESIIAITTRQGF